MLIHRLHDWNVSTTEAREVQLKLASQVVRQGTVETPRFIGAVDMSVNRFARTGKGAAVVLSWPALELVETQTVEAAVTFPYVPGLLSFREAPLVLAACEKLKHTPDLVFVDGQGLAHLRRLGIACHLGLVLDIPTIGCAKSRLIGEHAEPEFKRGSSAELTDNGEVIGAAVRTRDGVRPLYISIGHKIDLPNAIKWTLASGKGYRLPEPARLAHQATRVKSIQ